MGIAQSKQKILNSKGLSHFLIFQNNFIKGIFLVTQLKKHGTSYKTCSITVVVPANETIPCVITFRNFTIKTHERYTFLG